MTFDFFNIKINEHKELINSFKVVFGINYNKTFKLYKLLGLNLRTNWNLKSLTIKQIYKLKLYLPDITLFDSDLRRVISNEREKFLELKCYKRNRYLLSLPSNGQRTKTNAKTRKKLKN